MPWAACSTLSFILSVNTESKSKGVKGGACQRSQHGGMGASLEGTEKELGFWSQCRLKYHLIPILAVCVTAGKSPTTCISACFPLQTCFGGWQRSQVGPGKTEEPIVPLVRSQTPVPGAREFLPGRA